MRLWNPYVVKKPVALLTGHAMGIVDVKIHEQLNQIFSFSRDTVSIIIGNKGADPERMERVY